MSESNSFDQKISALLSNPEALAGIMNLAKSLGLDQNKRNQESESLPVISKPAEVEMIKEASAEPFKGTSNNIKGIELLLAIKPFLDHERADRLDKITQVLKIVSLTDLFK